MMKSRQKVGNTGPIRGEDFFLGITMIFGETKLTRNQSPFSFLEDINFCKSLPRAPKFEYLPLAKSVIQGCIDKKFHILSIEILKCCNKILFQIEKANFRKVVHFRKLAEKQRLVSES